MFRKALFILITIGIFSSCKQKENAIKPDPVLNELFSLMQGSFNSEKQSLADSSYYNISLHMYPIWKDQGHFLYVEQALSSMQDKPYRQRIYEVSRLNDSVLKSAVYTLPADSLWIGKWKTPTSFEQLSKEDLTLRNGCEVLLKKVGDQYYKGATGMTSCESSLRGASYTTSEVEIWNDKIISWDRGFDADGKHVWGAENGGYIFNKQN